MGAQKVARVALPLVVVGGKKDHRSQHQSEHMTEPGHSFHAFISHIHESMGKETTTFPGSLQPASEKLEDDWILF
jgi:hypothetical protein